MKSKVKEIKIVKVYNSKEEFYKTDFFEQETHQVGNAIGFWYVGENGVITFQAIDWVK